MSEWKMKQFKTLMQNASPYLEVPTQLERSGIVPEEEPNQIWQQAWGCASLKEWGDEPHNPLAIPRDSL